MSGTLGQASAFGGDDFVSAIRDRGEMSGPQAVSPKGAMGTMQVMPSTMQSPGFGLAPADPNDPGSVARLGEQYARAMLARYGGNQILASAAYNAGPGQVDKWIQQFGDPRTGGISNSDWQRKIPFQETRNYVGRVAPGALGQSGDGGGTTSPQTNPLSVQQAPPPTPEADTLVHAEPSGYTALALMQTLLPKSHKFVPVDYDPFSVLKSGGPG